MEEASTNSSSPEEDHRLEEKMKKLNLNSKKTQPPSSPPTLLTIDEDAFGKIMEKIDFRNIMALRKVCPTLRSTLSESKPEINLQLISINLLPKSLVSVDYGSGPIFYHPCGKGCAVEFNGNKKFLANVDNFENCFNDLQLNLEHQKPILPELKVELSVYERPDVDRFFTRVRALFAARSFKLKGNLVSLHVSNQEDVLSILPNLEPKLLEKIALTTSEKLTKTLDVREIIKLEQWKEADKVDLSNTFIASPMENFKHFSEVNLRMHSVKLEDIKVLKEMFFTSSRLQLFNIVFRDFNDRDSIYDFFGPTCNTETPNDLKKEWGFKIDETQNFLYVKLYDPKMTSFQYQPYRILDFSRRALSGKIGMRVFKNVKNN